MALLRKFFIQELREKQSDKKDNIEPKDDSRLFDIKMNLSSLREIIKNDLSENARFLSDGKGVPINDEKNIQLFYVIKENTIYIEDSAQNKSNNNSQENKQKIEKIPVILKIDDSTSIIKVSSTDKLDKIREENPNIIKKNYLFTLKGTIISRDQENVFNIDEIMDSSNTVEIQNNKPKMKIKTMKMINL